MNQDKTKQLVVMAMFCAIMGVMAVTNIGMIPLGFMNATTLHIPVILCAVLLGPKKGMLMGFLFGLISLLTNTFRPNITSFVFSPFYQSDYGNPLFSLLICFVPRILIGLVSALSYNGFKKTRLPSLVSLGITGFLGSITNTIFVMGGIWLLFGEGYAAAKGLAADALGSVIGSVVLINGIPEAIVAAILTAVIGKTLEKFVLK